MGLGILGGVRVGDSSGMVRVRVEVWVAVRGKGY